MLRDLAGDEVVFVVARDGKEHIGAAGAGFFEHGGLTAVSLHDDVAELVLNGLGGLGIHLDHEDFVIGFYEFLGEVEADLTTADEDDVQLLLDHRSVAVLLDELACNLDGFFV